MSWTPNGRALTIDSFSIYDLNIMAFLSFSIITSIALVLASIKIIDQYERGILLTLGQYFYTLQPGLKLVIPIIQRLNKVDIRTTVDIPQQEIITRDEVSASIRSQQLIHHRQSNQHSHLCFT